MRPTAGQRPSPSADSAYRWIFEGLSLSSLLNNSQNSILLGLREIHVSIMVRDVDDDIEWLGHISTLFGNL